MSRLFDERAGYPTEIGEQFGPRQFLVGSVSARQLLTRVHGEDAGLRVEDADNKVASQVVFTHLAGVISNILLLGDRTSNTNSGTGQ